MADLSKIRLNGTNYNLKDATARGALENAMIKGTDYVTAGQKSGTTLGQYATTEGADTVASAAAAHAEGGGTVASAIGAHAEGFTTVASGLYSHAEGNQSIAYGFYSHAEGHNTAANSESSHTEGNETTANGAFSHAEGDATIAQTRSQHVFGEFNIADTGSALTRGTYIEIVGNGSFTNGTENRSNARTLDWNGNEWLAGKLTLGAAPTNNMDAATKQYVDNAIPTVPTNVSSFTNDAGYLTSYTETDPTVPAWAKAANKPTYTANEVGALPNTTVIPTITDTYSSTSHNGMSGVAVNSAITTAIGNINSFDIAVVSSTSAVTTPNNHTIYFVPQAVNSSIHDEYMYINNNWELIGTTTIDLSGYLQSSDIAAWAKAANKPSYTASEVGALPSNTTYVSSFNGSSGAITYTAPVTSVNGQTGAVSLTIPTVPTNVSDFTNDAGYLTLATLPVYDGTVQNG